MIRIKSSQGESAVEAVCVPGTGHACTKVVIACRGALEAPPPKPGFRTNDGHVESIPIQKSQARIRIRRTNKPCFEAPVRGRRLLSPHAHFLQGRRDGSRFRVPGLGNVAGIVEGEDAVVESYSFGKRHLQVGL